MPSPTFDNIGTVTISSAQPSIEFTGVPSSYDNLMIIASLRSTTSGTTDEFYVRFNDDTTAANYPQSFTYTSGSGKYSTGTFTASGFAGIQTTASGNTGSTFSNTQVLIVNYKTSNTKGVIVESSTFNQTSATLYHKFGSGYWAPSTVVNKVALTAGSGNFAVYSTATLYGIKNT